MLELYQRELSQPVIEPGDLELIASQHSDFLGLNYYTRGVVKHDRETAVLGFSLVEERDEENWSEIGENYPEGLYEMLVRLDQEYDHPAIYITENGVSYGEDDLENGRVHDLRRKEFVEEHLKAAHRAIAEGVRLERYCLWSCFDNFEWLWGYSRRFGLFYVDIETQERIWK
ncbi:unnamed protein product, partial [Ectocarpus sp. 12 AP-2014]